MIVDSLKETGELLLSNPYLWIPGLAIGIYGASGLAIQYYLGSFIAERLWLLELLTIPFFIGGMLYLIKTGEKAGGVFVSAGVRYYFRILLPSIIIILAMLLTAALLAGTLALIGIGETALVLIIPGTVIPILFFTFFFDTAAVFEEKTVFESIRRSAEIVVNRGLTTFLFFISSLLIAGAIFFVAAIVWTALLYARLEPLTLMNATEIQSFSPDQFNQLLGAEGIWTTAVIFLIASSIAFSVIYVFKALIYQKETGDVKISLQEGEYDSKGRYYKY